MQFLGCKCGIKARTDSRGIKYTIFHKLVHLQRLHVAFGLMESHRWTNSLNIVYFIPWLSALAIKLTGAAMITEREREAGVWLFSGSATFQCFSFKISSLWPCLILLENTDFSVFQCFATLANHIPPGEGEGVYILCLSVRPSVGNLVHQIGPPYLLIQMWQNLVWYSWEYLMNWWYLPPPPNRGEI